MIMKTSTNCKRAQQWQQCGKRGREEWGGQWVVCGGCLDLMARHENECKTHTKMHRNTNCNEKQNKTRHTANESEIAR